MDKGLALQLYVQDNFKALDFSQQVFKATTKLGEKYLRYTRPVKTEKDKFDEFMAIWKLMNLKTIKAYLETLKERGSGLKEFDTISALISEILRRLKTENKQNVLIMTIWSYRSEHYSAFFNVLSAHRDYHTSKNKFGFDKLFWYVILKI